MAADDRSAHPQAHGPPWLPLKRGGLLRQRRFQRLRRCGILFAIHRARGQQRLMAVRLAMSGELTLAQIGKAVGKARSTVAQWMRVVRASGLEALLALHQGRGRAPQLQAKARKELRTGLRRRRWRRLKDAQQWLAERRWAWEASATG